MSRNCDVVILGAGPAGLAAAVRLAHLGRRVQVWTRPHASGPAVGESVGPEVRELLIGHGLGEGFDEIPYTTFVGTKVAWGSAEPYETSGILNPLGLGRHLDRDRFDAWMLKCAERAGAQVHVAEGPVVADDAEGKWLVRDGVANVSAPFLIDARGRNAPASGPKRAWIKFDRLIGIAAWIRAPASDDIEDAELLLEAEENGWWYSARLPKGILLATFMTDADLAGGERAPLRSWQDSLARARLTRDRIGNGEVLDLRVRRADSGYSFPSRGEAWIAIGDAARAVDPLSGTGIFNGIKSAFAAAGEIHDALSGSPIRGLGPDGKPMASRQLPYLRARSRYYCQESRWPESKFWVRRTGLNAEGFQCRLSPEDILSAGSGASDLDTARAECLLPYGQIADLWKFLHTPAAAYSAAEFLRQRLGPLDDGLLIAGLQLLLDCGALRTHPRTGV